MINISPGNGSLLFWFKPDWYSGSTNCTLGPSSLPRLIEIGGQDGPDGWWAVVLNTNGMAVSFITQTNGFSVTNLSATINWTSNDWHQIALTYSTTNSQLYLDGTVIVTNGIGVTYLPDSYALSSGFYIGSDNSGNNQAGGQFDELETFNYQLSANDIASNYVEMHLTPPTISLVLTNQDTACLINLQQTQATTLESTVNGLSYPDPGTFLTTEDYSDSVLAESQGSVTSKSVGLNISKLPPPVITPCGGYFNCPSNVILSLGAENLTNMVANIFITELGRYSSSDELQSVAAYAGGLRLEGLSDEDIRSTLINGNSFRNSEEYINEFGAPGDKYYSNTNYVINYSLDDGATWSIYVAPIEITNSEKLIAVTEKMGTTDARTRYAYLSSAYSTARFNYIPANWLIQYFGADYAGNTNAEPYADPDQDGLNNLLEYQYGTNPTNADTDSDGINDGNEVLANTDPLNFGNFPNVRLGYWRFNTTNWVGEQGQNFRWALPILIVSQIGVAMH